MKQKYKKAVATRRMKSRKRGICAMPKLSKKRQEELIEAVVKKAMDRERSTDVFQDDRMRFGLTKAHRVG